MIGGFLNVALAAVNLPGVMNGNIISIFAFGFCCLLSGFCFGISTFNIIKV